MKKKIGRLALILVVAAGAILFLAPRYNRSLTPPELVANFVDLNKVEAISTYRSCTGHTVVPQNGRELRRNMKHYVRLYPQYKVENTVEIFAPYDGTIALIISDKSRELQGEIWLAQDRGLLSLLPPLDLWMVSFEHILPRPDLRYGKRVKAGELIGYATFINNDFDPNFDVVYGKMGFPPKRVDNWLSPFSNLDSVFNHLNDRLADEYRQSGVDQESIIISRDARDQAPCRYKENGPYFEVSEALPNWVQVR